MAQRLPKKVKEFIDNLKNKLKPEKVILFGSRIRGDSLKSSDYDFLIVSKMFEKKQYHERVVSVLRLMKKPFGLDVVCLTPGEFEVRVGQISIVREATREGVTV